MDDCLRDRKSSGRFRDIGMEAFEKLLPVIERCLDLNHDINNPLTGIIAYAEFLRDDPGLSEEKRLDYLGQILACAERIQECTGKLGSEKARLSEELNLKL